MPPSNQPGDHAPQTLSLVPSVLLARVLTPTSDIDDPSPIPLDRIIPRLTSLVTEKRNDDNTEISIRSLLQGCHLLVPALRRPAVDAAYAARMAVVRAEVEARRYAKMVQSVDSKFANDVEGNRPIASAFRQSSIGFNILVTMGTAFAFFYMVSRSFVSDATSSIAIGAMGMAGALLLESVLFVIYAVSVDATEEREERRLEQEMRRRREGAAMAVKQTRNTHVYS